MCVGNGARRYRAVLEEKGAVVPADGDERHVPRARFHAQLAGELGPVEEIEPLYLRVPDAERSVAMTTVELRALGLSDLRAIEEIERRSYPTPWSRSMFAGELAKPSSICLGAFDLDGETGRAGRLPDRVAVRRRVARHEHRGRPGSPRPRHRDDVLERLFELTAEDARRGYTLEVRVSNTTAIALYERLGFESAASAAATTRTIARTR